MKKYKFAFIGSIILCASLSNQVCAATAYFSDEGSFLSAVQSLSVEGFEAFPATPQSPNPIVATNYTVSAGTDTRIGILDTTVGGVSAVEGIQYLAANVATGVPKNFTIVDFNFNAPINAFGVSIIDFGDQNPGTLTFNNDAGDTNTFASSGLPSGNVLFFGVINHDSVFSAVNFTATGADDGIGYDQMHYGVVPLPPAIWLLGSGILGLIGVSKKNKMA